MSFPSTGLAFISIRLHFMQPAAAALITVQKPQTLHKYTTPAIRAMPTATESLLNMNTAEFIE